jgi:hypothetical protein
MLTLSDITSHLLFGLDAWIGFLIVARSDVTSIAFRNARDGSSSMNPARIRLNAVGEYQIEEPTTEPAETYVSYAVVRSDFGQKTIAQEAP